MQTSHSLCGEHGTCVNTLVSMLFPLLALAVPLFLFKFLRGRWVGGSASAVVLSTEECYFLTTLDTQLPFNILNFLSMLFFRHKLLVKALSIFSSL